MSTQRVFVNRDSLSKFYIKNACYCFLCSPCACIVLTCMLTRETNKNKIITNESIKLYCVRITIGAHVLKHSLIFAGLLICGSFPKQFAYTDSLRSFPCHVYSLQTMYIKPNFPLFNVKRSYNLHAQQV